MGFQAKSTFTNDSVKREKIIISKKPEITPLKKKFRNKYRKLIQT